MKFLFISSLLAQNLNVTKSQPDTPMVQCINACPANDVSCRAHCQGQAGNDKEAITIVKCINDCKGLNNNTMSTDVDGCIAKCNSPDNYGKSTNSVSNSASRSKASASASASGDTSDASVIAYTYVLVVFSLMLSYI